ncbi:MAG: carbohydrate ABC transporter permease [Devosia sp.]|uniref:carbohydrate ABC transporter permease n=1 Tax=Devosia sp. TaxID=1871048 RepID=UPI001A42AAD5|nr:carbohydrate ABC transporter permease [Devosia sp.]MBL8598946.1 carbohydrate ABC transporter permease [Devosia sp.]
MRPDHPIGARRAVVGDIGLYIILTVSAIPFVLPMIWMIASSLKPESEMFAFPPSFLGSSVRWQNYVEVFTNFPYFHQYFNSTYVAALTVIGTAIVSTMSGFAFARIKFPFRNTLLVLMLTGLFLPIETEIVPLFQIMNLLGLTGTHIPLIIEPVFGAPSVVGTFIMRQAFLDLPAELEDAGRIDGLGWMGILWHIGVPLAWPSIATVSLLTFLSSWNMYLQPLVFTGGTSERWTVPLGLDQFVDFMGRPYWTLQMAATTLAVLPFVILFIWLQRQITEGIATSGLK